MWKRNVQGLENRCEGARALDHLRPTVLDKAPAGNRTKWESGVTLDGYGNASCWVRFRLSWHRFPLN
jgi:hypothetical protein